MTLADRNSKGLTMARGNRETQNRAALYARFSTDKQSSTDDQLRVCARIAEGAGFEVVRSFTDEAVSGARRSGLDTKPCSPLFATGMLM
jgi:hypothetical protein